METTREQEEQGYSERSRWANEAAKAGKMDEAAHHLKLRRFWQEKLEARPRAFVTGTRQIPSYTVVAGTLVKCGTVTVDVVTVA